MKKTILLLVLLFAALFSLGCVTGASGTNPVAGTDAGSGDSFSVPVNQISNQAKWFEWKTSDGVAVRFFALKAKDGSIKTAFDACDVCYAKKKGYRQEGNLMVCNNCGNKYPIDSLGTENKNNGGCWPGYLASNVVGQDLVITKADLEKGTYRFR